MKIFKLSTLIILTLLSKTSRSQSIEVILQTGHAKEITGISVSNDGKYFATEGADKTVKIWDTETGAIIKNFEGHSRPVQSSSFSQDGNYLVSSGDDSKVLLWKVNDNADPEEQPSFEESTANYQSRLILSKATKKEQTLGNFKNMFHGLGGSIIDCDISPDKSKKIGVKEDGTIYFWENSANIRGQANSGLGKSIKVFFSKDGKKYYIVTQNEIGVWSIKAGSKPKKVDLPVPTTKVAISPDRSTIAVLNEFGIISLYASKSLKLIGESKDTKASEITFGNTNEEIIYQSGKDINRYDFSTNKNTTVLTCEKTWRHFSYSPQFNYAIGIINDNEVVVRSLKNGSLVYNRPSVNIDYEVMRISPNWHYLINTSAEEGYIQVSDLIHAKTELVLPGKITNANAIALSNTHLAVPLATDEIAVYELRNLNLIQSIKVHNGNIAGAIINQQKDELIIWETIGIIEVYNLITGENIAHVNLTKPIHQVAQHDNSHCIAVFEDGGADRFSLTDPKEFHQSFECEPSSAIAVSENGGYMALETENNGVTVFDLNNNTSFEPVSNMSKTKINQFAFSSDGTHLVGVYENHQVRIWESATGFMLNTRTKGRRLCKPFPTSFSPDGKLIFLVNHDYNVLLWSWDTRPTPGAMRHKGNPEFEHRMVLSPDGTILQTDKNYYIVAGNGHELLNFRKDENVYSFDQFDLHYNRPDKVLDRIGIGNTDLIDIYKKAYNKRLERLGFKNSRVNNSYHLPKLSVINKDDIPFESLTKNIKLNISCTDSKVDLHLIKVYVNGVPINPTRGVKVPSNKREFETDVEIELSNGDNRIEVSCVNEYTAESYKTTINTRYKGDSKPNLYILSIGTSKYLNEAQNLFYASKDARDFVKAMSSSATAYQDILIYTLEDEQVTKDKIKASLDKLKKAGVDDHVYIFVAGHGQLDENLDYYIATHNMNFNNPSEQGFSYDDLEHSLEFIPSRHKVLFIDACHSGEIDKSGVKMVKYERKEQGKVNFRASTDTKVVSINNTLDMMKELFTDLENSSGTTIISSAGGGEFAVEGDEWSNGVFTYCLIEGITKGNADKNHDGQIMLSELFDYLAHRVPQITRGNQQPTSRAMNMKHDIRVK